jgi:energy-coupling factor transporter ATP-binding protein EcfA2
MMLIDQLFEKGKTIIIISHDMPLVAEHARRVVVLNKGQIALDGSPEAVFKCTITAPALLRSPQSLWAQELVWWIELCHACSPDRSMAGRRISAFAQVNARCQV